MNFIKFIRHYDELKIEITEENIINQIFDSLDRFSEMKSLPQNFICKLYPFKSSSESEFLIDKTTLLLRNKVVKKLFYEEIIIENDTIKYIPSKKLSYVFCFILFWDIPINV